MRRSKTSNAFCKQIGSRLKTLLHHFLLSYLVVAQLTTGLLAQSRSGSIGVHSFERASELDLEDLFGAEFVLVDSGFASRISPWRRSRSETSVNFSDSPNYTNFRFLDLRVGSGNQIRASLERQSGFKQLRLEYVKAGSRYRGSHYLIEAPQGDFVSVAEDVNFVFVLDENGVIYGLNKDDFRDRFGKYYPKLFPLNRIKDLDPAKSYSIEVYRGPMSLRGIEVDDVFLEEDLKQQFVREGALLVVEQDVSGARKLVDLFSRRNLLTAHLGKEDQLTSVILQLKYGETSPEYLEYRKRIIALEGEIGARAIAQGAEASAYEDELLRLIASFDGPASVEGLGSILTQINHDQTARGMKFSEIVEQSSLPLSSISREILAEVLEKGHVDELVKSVAKKLAERAKTSPDFRGGEFSEALQNYVRSFDRFESTLTPPALARSADDLILELFPADSAADLAEWVTTQAQHFSSDEVHLIRVIAAAGKTFASEQKPTQFLIGGAFIELRERLSDFSDQNPILKSEADGGSFANEFEKLFQAVKQASLARTDQEMLRALEELRRLTHEEAPTVALSDFLIAARAIESGNTEYEEYVREAGVIPPQHRSWMKQVAHKAGPVLRYPKQFADIPHFVMLGLLAVTSAFFVMNSDPELMEQLSPVTAVVDVWSRPEYIPDLLKTWSLQIALYVGIHASFTGLAAAVKKPVGWVWNHYNKEGFKWFCFPFGAFIRRFVLGQKNAVYAAKNGVTALNPRFLSTLQLPSYLSSREQNERARARVVDAVNSAQFLRGASERFAAWASTEIVAQRAGMNTQDLSPQSLQREWEKFRAKRFEALLAEMTEELKAAKASGDPIEIQRVLFESEERKIEELQRVTSENAMIRRLTQVTTRKLRSKLSASPDFTFDSLRLDQAQTEKARLMAQEIGTAYAASSRFSLWVKELGSYLRYFPRDQMPGFLNYPLSTFESLDRAVPKTNVGQTAMSYWQGDMLTQYIFLGIYSGFPGQAAFSPGGWLHDMDLYVRANPETPEQLFAQPFQMVRTESGGIEFLEGEAASWHLLNTHPHEMTSLMFQHGAYMLELNSTNLTEVAAGDRVANPYSDEEEVPEHERHESFFRSLSGLAWSALHVREYNAMAHINNKFMNIFKFFQPRLILFSACMLAFAGGNPFLAVGTFFFFAAVKYFAYAWPWSPLFLGSDHRTNRLAQLYESFVKVRKKFSAALAEGDITGAKILAADLNRLYDKGRQKFPFKDFIYRNGVSELSAEDLSRIEDYIYRVPASARFLNPGLEKTVGFVLGGVPTTILGMMFMISVLMIQDPVVQYGLGAAGFLGYGLLNRGFWAYDKLMKRSGMDRLIRKMRFAREWVRSEALGKNDISRAALEEYRMKERSLAEALRRGEITESQYHAELDQLTRELASKTEKIEAPKSSKPPGLVSRCIDLVRKAKGLSAAHP